MSHTPKDFDRDMQKRDEIERATDAALDAYRMLLHMVLEGYPQASLRDAGKDCKAAEKALEQAILG